MADLPRQLAELTPLQQATLGLKTLRERLDRELASRSEPIAVIGMGCRFPGADDVGSFWRLLVEGRDAITEVPPDRWDVDALYDPDPDAAGRMYTRFGGFIQDVDAFDPMFFGISPREAASMDPQQRILLEVAWQAMEDAGLTPDHLGGSATGVYVGMSTHDYSILHARQNDPAAADAHFGTGTAYSVAAGRLSYLLGLHGPSITIDTACSSSLVAVHLAVQSLRSGESDLAFAGGVNVILAPDLTLFFCRAGGMARDGRCKTFDASADGYVRAEGCGVVVLKRLSDAFRDGDRVRAIVRGTAVNHDGRSSGLTAPNGLAQRAVVRQALKAANMSPARVSYVEAHGTGTPLGDPIELQALGAVLQEGRAAESRVAIGSLKTNVGHLEAAAGVAGLIKVVLCLEHRQLPPSLHFRAPNPHAELDTLPLRVCAELRDWSSEQPLVAGVSSFGISGTNAHAIVEEAPVVEAGPAQHPSAIVLPISARTPVALNAVAAAYAAELSSGALADVPPHLVAASAAHGRAHLDHRLALVATSRDELVQQIGAFLRDEKRFGLSRGTRPAVRPVKLAFVLPGQGTQWAGMGRQLFESEPAFRTAFERCAEAMKGRLEVWLVDELLSAAPRLEEIHIVQPMLFALQVSLAALLGSWGIDADAVVGHSMGEVAAAHIAGVISLEEAARIITTRSALLRQVSGRGGMLVARLSLTAAEEIAAARAERVAVAASNGPASTVLSGDADALKEIAAELDRRDVHCRLVKVEVASHSPQVDAVRSGLLASFADLRPAAVTPLFRSTVPGGDAVSALDALYWWRNLRLPVLFTATIRRLIEEGFTTFVELSPHPTLTEAVSETAAEAGAAVVAVGMQQRDRDGSQAALAAVGALHAAGHSLDWSRLYSRRRPHVRLPHHPFRKDRVRMISNPSPSRPSDIDRREEQILAEIVAITARAMEADAASIDADLPFPNMGADSLVMGRAVKAIERRFHVPLSLRRLFGDLGTARAVARHVASQLPDDDVATRQPDGVVAVRPRSSSETRPAADEVSAPAPAVPGAAGDASAMERIVAQQLQAFSQIVAAQLAIVGQAPARASVAPAPASVVPAPASVVPAPTSVATAPDPIRPGTSAANGERYRPYQRVTPPSERSGLDDPQKAHLESLVARYTARTARSKALAAEARGRLADSRACVGFRPAIKEMLYPLARSRARGARIWDIDGNEYIDMTMGFGVNLFGHGEPFIQEALETELRRGVELGTRSELVGEASSLVCELTGMERACFLNSGTEAVMIALRLARAAKERRKVVLFDNFYHGQSDMTLARRDEADGSRSLPIAPGVPPGAVEDILVLDYGDPRSLEVIRKRAGEIAAVLVEPIQSRNVELQPREFVRDLRTLTAELDIALVFDEMITGFRLHPRGAQAWYGVQADLATYGKIIGGGMPIGVIAGRAEFLDRVDGGAWRFGDGSFPAVETTFVGGTFCQHPLAMAGATAVLRELRRRGPGLQEALNAATDALSASLNELFLAEEVPIRAVNAGSIFRFKHAGNLDLLFFHLIERGIFIWEWRSCYLSTAHTDEDYVRIQEAVRASIDELRRGRFLPERTGASPGSAPLVDTQQLIWAAAEMSVDGTRAYNESLALRLLGPLDVDALRSALRAVVARHEALRTRIADDGESQSVLPDGPVDLTITDLRPTGPSDRGLAAERWLRTESARPFDLTAGPPLRAGLALLGEAEQLLLITVHHILVDGWSGGLLIEEIGRHYAAAREGRALALAPAPRFSEYGRAREKRSSAPAVLANQRYWREQFTDGIPELALPLDRPRPLQRSFRGERRHLTIDATRTRELRAFSRQHGVTLFVTLLSTWVVLLRRLAGTDDVTVGIPTPGRELPESDGVVGNCVVPIPLRVRLAGDPPFAEMLAAVKHTFFEGMDRGEFSFVKLLEEVGYEKTPHGTPLFSVTFNMDRRIELPSFGDLAVEIAPVPASFSKFDLGVNVIEHADQLLVDVDYNADLFERSTIDRTVEQMMLLLDAVVRSPTANLSALPMVGPADRALLLGEWNAAGTGIPSRSCVHELFEAQAVRRPDAVALLQGDSAVSYGALNANANRLARHLRRLGVGRESRVGVCLERSPRFVEALLAILKAGAAYVPIEVIMPTARIRFMLEDASVGMVLAQTSTRASIEATGWSGRLVLLDEEAGDIELHPDENLANTVTAENVAYVIYTSGSTGQPKGIEIPHRAIPGFAFGVDYVVFDEGHVVLQHSSISWDPMVLELWPILLRGGRCVLYAGRVLSPADLVELVARHGITTLWLTASAFSTFMDSEPEALRGIPQLLCGGEVVSPVHARRAVEMFPESRLVNGYGPCEATVFCVCHVFGSELPPDAMSVPIGRPIGDRRVYLLDEQMELVPIGAVGELCVGGPGVARSYLRRPALTAERFVPDPFGGVAGARLYRTGDLARWVDGKLEFLGRKDRQVKLRGFRVELGEIEAVLERNEHVRQAVVRVWQRAGEGRLVGYVVAREADGVTAEDLRTYLQERLPDYMVPSAVVLLAAMPSTPGGKIDYLALPEPRWELASSAGWTAPRTPLEELVASTWRAVLGVERVGAHDSFFALGGHSLSATRIASRLRKMFRVDVRVQSLFQSPTVAEIARLLGEKRPSLRDEQRIEEAVRQIRAMTAEQASRELKSRRPVDQESGGAR